MGAVLGRPAVEQHEDLVGAANRGEAVGDEHHHAIASEFAEALEEIAFGAGIERCGRFVHDDERRVAEEGPGDGDTLPLPDRQFGPSGERGRQSRFVAGGQRGDEVVDAGSSGGVSDRVARRRPGRCRRSRSPRGRCVRTG